MTDDRSIDARVAALRSRRGSSSPFGPPSGAAVDLPVPPADAVAMARGGRRRTLPARRTRIGVTLAAAAGFVALVPVMGPLTAAPTDDDVDPVDPANGSTNDPEPADSVPVGSVDTTIELTPDSTDVPVDTLDAPVVESSVPAIETADPGAAPVNPSAAPAPAPVPVQVAPAPAPPTAPAPAPAPAPTVTPPPAPPAPAPATTVARPAPTAPPVTAPPVTTPPPPPVTTPPPPPPPPTTAPPPPPVTSPS